MPRKIVVVDDSRDFVEMMQALLEQAGYEVLPLVDSLKARSVIQQERPDLLILDIMMPGLDGWEVLDALRKDPDTEGLPVLVTTGALVNAHPGQRLPALAGVEFLPKPFSVDELLRRVEDILAPHDS